MNFTCQLARYGTFHPPIHDIYSHFLSFQVNWGKSWRKTELAIATSFNKRKIGLCFKNLYLHEMYLFQQPQKKKKTTDSTWIIDFSFFNLHRILLCFPSITNTYNKRNRHKVFYFLSKYPCTLQPCRQQIISNFFLSSASKH